MTAKHPLVYSCSGCSSAAQLANWMALQLDRDGSAEMSCIAGVGGGVPNLVRLARSGRPIVALDGCPLQCVRHCLARHRIEADLHVVLSEHGVKKRKHRDFDPSEGARLLRELLPRIQALGLPRDAPAAEPLRESLG